ncbi:DEAD/DEAH box helicase [Vallitalea guaymasensis]|uniref:DEAD/DEAH box helicase n=1 Tax=Vallitalea guaymasensis TaxID=1185412 RepID=UPI000DE2DEA6|nr:DEAD/DEAH box helicase [Vallitalea guaymasensis]
MIDKGIVLPDYLVDPCNINHYYGELIYEDNYWVIEGEPVVCQMAKKLFPGSSGKGRGKAKFPASKRTMGDLNWLMLRYPLKIRSKKIWDEKFNRTKEHIIKREQINNFPVKIEPDPLYFKAILKDFQKEGVGYMLQNQRALLADEMGLGKTVETLALISQTQSYPAILVVPPHLRTNWIKEIKKFSIIDSKLHNEISIFDEDSPIVHEIKGLKPYELPKAHFYVIHYLLLRGWNKVLPKIGAKMVIFDEIQELRHAGTLKYSAASMLSASCDNVYGLSGTPIYNHGGEIWNVMNIIDYHCLGDWDSFTREWCYGYGSDIVVDPALLGEHLKREGLLLRRTKKEVLKELPPKRRVVQHIDQDECLFKQLISKTFDKVLQIDKIDDQFKKGRLIRDIVNETRRATGIAKAPHVCDFVKALLEAGEKVLLFAYHHDVMDIYENLLQNYNPMFITGRQNQKEKDKAVDNFMNGSSNLCCISLRAAAGLNLQRASIVIFGELDWSPAIHSQGEDRAHRIGQIDSILCYYLVASGGSDEKIQESLGLKVSQFVGLMGDEVVSEKDNLIAQVKAKEHMMKIIELVKEKVA